MNNLTNPNALTLSDYAVTPTRHAEIRMQQRCIKESWLALILEFGKRCYQNGKKSCSIFLDKKGIKKLKEAFGDLVDVNKIRNIYIIISNDNVLVTCAYRG